MAKEKSSQEPQDQSQATATSDGQQQLQVYAAPDLEYTYRDFFSLYVGSEEVLVEFGNRHRAQSNRATVHNRIVLSIPNAFRLQQALARSLDEARKRMQQAQEEQQQQQSGGAG